MYSEIPANEHDIAVLFSPATLLQKRVRIIRVGLFFMPCLKKNAGNFSLLLQEFRYSVICLR